MENHLDRWRVVNTPYIVTAIEIWMTNPDHPRVSEEYVFPSNREAEEEVMRRNSNERT